MNKTLVRFEQFINMPANVACLVLGIAYVTYAHYRNESRPLPGYHRRHILNLARMDRSQLDAIIEEVRNGNR